MEGWELLMGVTAPPGIAAEKPDLRPTTRLRLGMPPVPPESCYYCGAPSRIPGALRCDDCRDYDHGYNDAMDLHPIRDCSTPSYLAGAEKGASTLAVFEARGIPVSWRRDATTR